MIHNSMEIGNPNTISEGMSVLVDGLAFRSNLQRTTYLYENRLTTVLDHNHRNVYCAEYLVTGVAITVDIP